MLIIPHAIFINVIIIIVNIIKLSKKDRIRNYVNSSKCILTKNGALLIIV